MQPTALTGWKPCFDSVPPFDHVELGGMASGTVDEIFAGLEQKTMKWRSYFPVYQELLQPFVGKPVTIVEIGILNGGSLFMWREFLGPQARIIGIDNNPNAKRMEQHGFEIFVGDQADEVFWAEFFAEVGNIDVLIDDGGHTNKQQITTVESALGHINDGGVILIEDTHTSYMKHFGNPSKFSFMNFAYRVGDAIQARSPITERIAANRFERSVWSVTVFESMVCFRVNRALCQPSEIVEAGSGEIGAVDHRNANHWDPVAAWPAIAARVGTERMGKAVKKVRGIALRAQMWAENQRLRKYFEG